MDYKNKMATRIQVWFMRNRISSLNKLQYLHTGKMRQKRIKVSERLVHLGYIGDVGMKNVLRGFKIETGGEVCPLSHPQKSTVTVHLQQLAKIMSAAKYEMKGVYPLIGRSTRNNIYTSEDYIDFGDKVIEHYMLEHPISKWKVRWDWSPFSGFIEVIV